MCDGLDNGFDTLISCEPHQSLVCSNLLSATSEPDVVDSLIETELERGYLLGPYTEPPFERFRINPIGVATGKYSLKKRLIVDLSAPHDNMEHASINDTIDKELCSLSYVKVDDAIKIIRQKGKGARLCKVDIRDAFKLIPIRKDQWAWFGIKWRTNYYFYHRLAFGCRSSPAIFDNLSRALCWIAENNYGITDILHLLDDFLTVDDPDSIAERTMALLTQIFGSLNIPLSPTKTEGPSVVIEYLGIILDSINMEARLPQEKIDRILSYLDTMVHRGKCTKRELLVLLGHLNFASRIILAGRSFVSYLISLSTKVRKLHHFVNLNQDCQKEIHMWKNFLVQWNGVSMFYDQYFTSAADMELFTDASSTVGYGGYHGQQWFAEEWSEAFIQQIGKGDLISMSFMELYPIVVAALLWGHQWHKKKIMFHCDNEGTVCIINKGRSKSPLIMQLMRRLTLCSMTHNFCVCAQHIPGKNNNAADFLSRQQLHLFRKIRPDADLHPQLCPPASDVMLN